MSDLLAASVLPKPQRCEHAERGAAMHPRRFELSTGSTSTGRLVAAVARLNLRLRQRLGYLEPRVPQQVVPLTLRATQLPGPMPTAEAAEDYRMQVTASGVVIDATSEWGLLHGIETLLQSVIVDGSLALGLVADEPRFTWRGLLLDVARRYLSLEALQRTIDCMASVKLNVLHLHLSDDQGFRFRSERFPRLASAQAYSAEELRGLVAYAADRAIRIVPEFDMPGHVTSWLVQYPEWGTEPVEPSESFGVHEATLNPANEAVYQALDTLFEELATVFPDRYFHIGGDEVNPGWWQRSQVVQDYMAAHGLADIAALQAHFSHRVRELLLGHDRLMVVWDEALHPRLEALEPRVVVQNWRGATTRDRALQGGHPCLVSSGYYLDLHFPAQWHYLFDPSAAQGTLLAHEDSLLERLDFANVADGIRWTHQWREGAVPEAEFERFSRSTGTVLGGEACLWGELVDDATIDLRLWTRLPAVAERFWSAASVRDCDELYARTELLLTGWRLTGRNDILERQARGLQAAGVDGHWQAMLAWFEPVKWYGRLLGEQALQTRLAGDEMPKARPYQAHTPLTTPVDHLAIESLPSRELERALNSGQMSLIAAAAAQWRETAAANDCPTQLHAQRQALSELAELVQARLDGAALGARERKRLRRLQHPIDDMLLAPAFTLARWLEGDVE